MCNVNRPSQPQTRINQHHTNPWQLAKNERRLVMQKWRRLGRPQKPNPQLTINISTEHTESWPGTDRSSISGRLTSKLWLLRREEARASLEEAGPHVSGPSMPSRVISLMILALRSPPYQLFYTTHFYSLLFPLSIIFYSTLSAICYPQTICLPRFTCHFSTSFHHLSFSPAFSPLGICHLPFRDHLYMPIYHWTTTTFINLHYTTPWILP